MYGEDNIIYLKRTTFTVIIHPTKIMCVTPTNAILALDELDEESELDEEQEYKDKDKDKDKEEEHVVLRAKWILDDSENIDQCIDKLNAFIEYLKSIKSEGWELRDPVNDDWGFLYKSTPTTTPVAE